MWLWTWSWESGSDIMFLVQRWPGWGVALLCAPSSYFVMLIIKSSHRETMRWYKRWLIYWLCLWTMWVFKQTLSKLRQYYGKYQNLPFGIGLSLLSWDARLQNTQQNRPVGCDVFPSHVAKGTLSCESFEAITWDLRDWIHIPEPLGRVLGCRGLQGPPIAECPVLLPSTRLSWLGHDAVKPHPNLQTPYPPSRPHHMQYPIHMPQVVQGV